MTEYHVHEFPPCADDCACKGGAVQPCSTLDFHPADCDMSLAGIVRDLSPEEQAMFAPYLPREVSA